MMPKKKLNQKPTNRIFITDNACIKFMRHFCDGVEKVSVARKIIRAMLERAEIVPKTLGKNPQCLVAIDKNTGKRVFFVVIKDQEKQRREVVLTILTQKKACLQFGLTYSKDFFGKM